MVVSVAVVAVVHDPSKLSVFLGRIFVVGDWLALMVLFALYSSLGAPRLYAGSLTNGRQVWNKLVSFELV